MTEIKVVDASALAALLFVEPEAGAIAARLDDARLVAPSLLDVELANVCLTKLRRTADQRDALLTAFRARRRLGIESMAVETDSVVAVAIETGLTAYDATYLWLARELDAELVTLDRQLQRAANQKRQSRAVLRQAHRAISTSNPQHIPHIIPPRRHRCQPDRRSNRPVRENPPIQGMMG